MNNEPLTILDQSPNGFPIVASYYVHPAVETPFNIALSKVWCPYCWRWHTHGRADGHRVSHCTTDDSPFLARGYSLREVGPWTPELAKYGTGRAFWQCKPFHCHGCGAYLSGAWRGKTCPKCGQTPANRISRQSWSLYPRKATLVIDSETGETFLRALTGGTSLWQPATLANRIPATDDWQCGPAYFQRNVRPLATYERRNDTHYLLKELCNDPSLSDL